MAPRKRATKPTRKKRGILKNAFEKGMFASLKKNKRLRKVEYETHYLPYLLEKKYLPDFVCFRKDGTMFFIEAKGYLRPADRTKLMAITKMDPRPDVRLVFQKNNKISAHSNTRYSDWAERHGFPWAIGEPAEEWFE